MRLNISTITVYLLLAVFSSCGDCLNVDCFPGPSAVLRMTFSQDGEQVLLSDNTFLASDDISLRIGQDEITISTDSLRYVEARLMADVTYVLYLGTVDTIEITTEMMVNDLIDGCCPVYGLSSISLDGVKQDCDLPCSTIDIVLD